MRHTIIIITILLSTQVSGQNHFIGLKGGVNWTNVITDDFLPDREYRTGFNTGLSYDYQFNDHFFCGAELIYSQKGFTNDVIFTNENGDFIDNATIEFNYDYLSIPIKAGVQFGNRFVVFGSLAIVPSFLVSAKTIEPAVEGILDERENDIKDRVTSFDLSGIVEIGAKLQLSERSKLLTSIGYQRSLTTITNEDYFRSQSIYHYGIAVSIGLQYALKKE